MTTTRLAIGLVAAGALLAWSTPAEACGSWGQGEYYANSSVDSCDGHFRLAMQSDGNLVVYDTSNWAPLWATNRTGPNDSQYFLAVQGDGNLVVYRFGGYVMWASNQMGWNVYLAMQDDGNLVVYNGWGGVVWASNVLARSTKLSQNDTENECLGRCGAGCGGWMPFGGGIWTSECYAHDICVGQRGQLACIPEFIPAAVSYLVQVVHNFVDKVVDWFRGFFSWW